MFNKLWSKEKRNKLLFDGIKEQDKSQPKMQRNLNDWTENQT